MLGIVSEQGLKDELVLADPTLPRFVYWKGDLYALPGALQVGNLIATAHLC